MGWLVCLRAPKPGGDAAGRVRQGCSRRSYRGAERIAGAACRCGDGAGRMPPGKVRQCAARGSAPVRPRHAPCAGRAWRLGRRDALTRSFRGSLTLLTCLAMCCQRLWRRSLWRSNDHQPSPGPDFGARRTEKLSSYLVLHVRRASSCGARHSTHVTPHYVRACESDTHRGSQPPAGRCSASARVACGAHFDTHVREHEPNVTTHERAHDTRRRHADAAPLSTVYALYESRYAGRHDALTTRRTNMHTTRAHPRATEHARWLASSHDPRPRRQPRAR